MAKLWKNSLKMILNHWGNQRSQQLSLMLTYVIRVSLVGMLQLLKTLLAQPQPIGILKEKQLLRMPHMDMSLLLLRLLQNKSLSLGKH